VESPQRVGPALLDKSAIGLSHLGPKAFRASCAAKSSCATYGQPGNCLTPDLPSAV
jgi:hypothetical protein